MLIPKFQVNARYYGVHIYLETRAFLASPQVQAPQFPVYISHFFNKLQKKQTPEKGFALIEKRYHTIFYRHDTCILLRVSYRNVALKNLRYLISVLSIVI